MDLIALITALISSVPKAVELWELIAPHVDAKLDIPAEKQAVVDALVPEATAAVSMWHAILAAPNPAGAAVQAVTKSAT